MRGEGTDDRKPFNSGRYSGLSEIVLWPVPANTTIDAMEFGRKQMISIMDQIALTPQQAILAISQVTPDLALSRRQFD